jgi:NhaP-type Na+/H+ or K+/H+ antiporter
MKEIVAILALGVGAQWAAWRLGVPAILLLLLFGLLAGPVFNVIDPQALIGDALYPIVSLAVGIILFEGGMSLRLHELKNIATTVRRLCTVGAPVTWLTAWAAARWILGLSHEMASLLGAVVVVTGPTVIIPLLRQVRLRQPVANILRWEGILIDPVGAILAVLVFDAITQWSGGMATAHAALGLAKATASGVFVGAAGAGILIALLRRYYIPDYLQNPVALTAVGATMLAGNALQHESGVLAVTVMGLVLGQQTTIPVRSILEFKETLRVLFISTLFIVLAAGIDPSAFKEVLWPGAAFVLFLVSVSRPLSVAAATLGSPLSWRERVMIACMAPRGIVAAAVASVFSIRLQAAGVAGAELLAPLTFIVITGTILFYALLAPVASRMLDIAAPPAQGVLFFGAHRVSRAIAKALKEAGFPVLLADSDYLEARDARMDDLPVYYGNVVSDDAHQSMNTDGLGKLLALSANDNANSLAAIHLVELFGRSEVYQLAPGESLLPGVNSSVPVHLRGRTLFAKETTYGELEKRIRAGAKIKRTPISDEFGMDEYHGRYGGAALPLFLVDESKLEVFAVDNPPKPKPGQAIIALIDAEALEAEAPDPAPADTKDPQDQAR